MNGISGYAVVRKPARNLDEIPHKDLILPAPRIGSIYYGGIDRMLWEDADVLHHAGSLPGEMELIWQELRRIRGEQQGLRTLKNRSKAEKILRYVNNTDEKNEMIYVKSGNLDTEIKEKENIRDLDFLGMDIYMNGVGSMIREGMFEHENIFSKYLNKINPNGLFSESGTVEIYKSFYESESKLGKVMPFPRMTYRKNCFRVYRVL